MMILSKVGGHAPLPRASYTTDNCHQSWYNQRYFSKESNRVCEFFLALRQKMQNTTQFVNWSKSKVYVGGKNMLLLMLPKDVHI